MRWLWPIVVAACSRPPAPACPVCAPAAPPPVAKAAAPDPMRLARACAAVELGVKDQIHSLQLLAHDVVVVSRVMPLLEKKREREMQKALEDTMATVVARRPAWAFLTYPLKLAASSPNPPALDVLAGLREDGLHTATLRQHDGGWTLFVGAPISAFEAGATFVLWRPVDFVSLLGDIANATLTIAEKVEADVRGTSCHELDDKRMAIKVGAAYVIVQVKDS